MNYRGDIQQRQTGDTNTICLFIHYKAEKARQFNEWKDDSVRYLDAFVNEDLEALGFPPCHTCGCTWRSAVMRYLGGGNVIGVPGRTLHPGVVGGPFHGATFKRIFNRSLISLSINGGRLHIPAPGMKAPADTLPSSAQFHNQSAYFPESGKAPRAPRSIALARAAASPISRPTRQDTYGSTMPRKFTNKYPVSAASRNNARTPSVSFSPCSTPEPTPPNSTLASAMPSSHGGGTPTQPAKRTVPPAYTQQSQVTRSQSANTASDPTPDASAMAGLTRSLEDVGREITTLAAREKVVVQRLAHYGVRPPPDPSVVSFREVVEERKATQDEISALRAQLEAEAEARRAAESALQAERRRRELAEGALMDVRRECTAPFVVPALMDAFLDMSRLTGELFASSVEYRTGRGR
ncbi:uncharacterized protein B0H18DRAFT_1179370 [Fomitopsis serialis]|uniref:uncharacterized protein n=1 Tax=Fomitopsis serialis TaxID=139415 RepID=UPI002008C2A0|nr:uncharacterized protein B0H18DRAFT_1179370 [Neoantrodia serialis]KAH9923565.1 hypothetical protein B0H18DRAFT_1179370 [Neoantrodia serialis]